MNTTTNNIVRCIDYTKLQSWECNARLTIVDVWLCENIGPRWDKWDWSDRYGYGYVEIKDCELAMLFKLKFGC